MGRHQRGNGGKGIGLTEKIDIRGGSETAYEGSVQEME